MEKSFSPVLMKRLFQITKTEAHYILSSADEPKEEIEILGRKCHLNEWWSQIIQEMSSPFSSGSNPITVFPWLDYFDLLQEKQIKRVE